MGLIIGSIVAIYRKELQNYFASPLAYVVAAVFWFFTGGGLVTILLGPDGLIQQAALRDLQAQQIGVQMQPIDVPSTFLEIFLFNVMGSLALFILPILSMGLYAEERRRGTLELLATSPVTNWSVAIGKLLGVLTFFITMILPLLAYEALVFSASSPAIQPAVPLLAHTGLILLAASVLSLGMFVSSLTDSSFLAGFLTFVLIFILWVIDIVAKSIGGPIGQALEYLSLLKHYNNLVQGVVDTSSLIIFASYIILGLFLTAQSIDALRFQRS